MLVRQIGKLLAVALLAAATAVAAARQQTVSVTLTQTVEDATRYSLVISDSDERTVSGMFSVAQLKVLQAVMAEAKKFAMTDETASNDGPAVTRFMNQEEPSFVVDVEKFGTKSEVFLTLNSDDTGSITITLATISRATGKGSGPFFDLASKVDSAVAKSHSKTSR